MRPDCILQQLARGCISSRKVRRMGAITHSNLQTKATSPHVAFGQLRPFPSSLHYAKSRTGQGEMSMRQAKWGAQIFKEWQNYLLHMSNSILLVKML